MEIEWDGKTPPPIEELRLSNLKGDGKLDNGRYSWEKKYSVVAVYMTNGSVADTSRETGVQSGTLELWRKQPWWPKFVDDIKVAKDATFKSKLSRIIDKSLGTMEDRLENGEIITLKDGSEARRPVQLRDATRAATELMRQKNYMEKDPLSTIVQAVTIKEALKELNEGFATLWKNRNQNQPTELEEIEDAVYEERAP